MSTAFNYRHLYYFWVVAREGGMARAASRLGIAVQTISTQVGELERALGHSLLKPAGRGLELTEAGQAALQQAEAIFELGQALPALVQDAAGDAGPRLQLGVGDGVPKLMVQRLLQPLLATPQLRLRCSEGGLETMLAELALHRLDLVLSDRPAPLPAGARSGGKDAKGGARLKSQLLQSSALAWYAAPALAARLRVGFPHSLAQVPVLLPLPASATRERLDTWLAERGLAPPVAGEFEDSALLKTFGAAGMGAFAAPELLQQELLLRYQVQRVAPCEGVHEHCWGISAERKLPHPLVQQLLATAQHNAMHAEED